MTRPVFFSIVMIALSFWTHAAEPEGDSEPAAAQVGTTIVGDQEAPLGLFLAPWKDASRSEVMDIPGLYDTPLDPVSPEGFARSARYYSVGRAYRTERLMRNH